MNIQNVEKYWKEQGREISLLVDSQDIVACLESIGKRNLFKKYQSFFVVIGDGEYLAVYACKKYCPSENEQVTKVNFKK